MSELPTYTNRSELISRITSGSTASEPGQPRTPVYRKIGAGCCGTVWAVDGKSYALKRHDGSIYRNMWNEYLIQTRVSEAFNKVQSNGCAFSFLVPQCHFFTNPQQDASWFHKETAHSPSISVPCNTMCVERIHPLPAPLVQTLVEKYSPATALEDARHSCLARLYLGRRQTEHQARSFSSHLNLPLTINRLEELQLDTLKYATILADALAFMHWGAHVDANDVEFVLGSPRRVAYSDHFLPYIKIEDLEPGSSTREMLAADHDAPTTDPPNDAIQVWLLDFDCARVMTVDEAGVEQAVAAYFRNDPYYPRPQSATNQLSPDQALWDAFKCRYLRTSSRFITKDGVEERLPDMFVVGVEKRALGDGNPRETQREMDRAGAKVELRELGDGFP